MSIDAIGAVSDPSKALTNVGLTQQDFLKILIRQLQFQDPTEPMRNEEFVAQLAQFSALEINRQSSDKIDSLLSVQATNQAIALIGKQVELRGEQAGKVGNVTAISFATGEPELTVTTASGPILNVHLADIALIR